MFEILNDSNLESSKQKIEISLLPTAIKANVSELPKYTPSWVFFLKAETLLLSLSAIWLAFRLARTPTKVAWAFLWNTWMIAHIVQRHTSNCWMETWQEISTLVTWRFGWLSILIILRFRFHISLLCCTWFDWPYLRRGSVSLKSKAFAAKNLMNSKYYFWRSTASCPG